MKRHKKRKIEWGSFSLRGFTELQWYAALVVVVSVLLIGWTSMMGLLGFNVSFDNILYLHRHLFAWLFDLLVVAVLGAVLYVANFKRISLARLRGEVEGLQGVIADSMAIADDISSGHDIDRTRVGTSSLGQTLLNLGVSLQDTRQKEASLNWVARGKEMVSDILRAHTRVDDLAEATIEAIISYCNAVQAAFYALDGDTLRTVAQYAYDRKRFEREELKVGRGLIGAAAYEGQTIYRTEIPDDYFTITSGLIGTSRPKSLLIIPLKQEDEVQGVIEVAFLQAELPHHYLLLADEIGSMVGATLYNLKTSERTEALLRDSQQLTATLRKNEQQLNENARDMRDAQESLERSNSELERKVKEIEEAQRRQDAMLRNASEFISIYDDRGQVVYESPSMKRILGYDPDDDVHGMDEDLMSPRSFRRVQSMFDYLMSTPGGEQKIEYTFFNKKKSRQIHLETRGKNLLHDPAIRGLIFNTRDVTERHLRELEEKKTGRMKSLSENSPDIIIRTSLKGKIQYSNPAAAKFLGGVADGASKERMLLDLVTEDSLRSFVEAVLRGIGRSKRQESAELEFGDKVKTYMEVKAIPELDDDGKVDSALFTIHDITEIKQLEQEAQKAREDVMASINYAKRIQFALLPEESDIKARFNSSFMFYRPKNIVSGDFPWILDNGGVTWMAVVDCTGHGVPGALLSIIGYLLLSNIVGNNPGLTPAEVLDRLHEAVRDALKQKTSEANAGDGMDLGLVRVDPAARQLQFAGAHRPLYYLHQSRAGAFDGGDDCRFQEFEGTRKGIGGKPLPNGRPEKPFANNVIDYQPGDRFFVFSDGLPDQLGGPEHKKFFTRRVKEWLARNVENDMNKTSSDLQKTFREWRGGDKQVDDVLLIGVEL